MACAGDSTSLVQVVQGNIVFDIATGRFRLNIGFASYNTEGWIRKIEWRPTK